MEAAKNQGKSRKNKIVKFDSLFSVKDIEGLKVLNDPITRNIVEDIKDMERGNTSKKEFDFANNAQQNARFNLQWNYQDITDKLIPFDKAVYDAVCTLFANGIRVQTPQQIYELATGKKYKSRKQQNERILASMRRLRRLELLFKCDDTEISLSSDSPKKLTKDIKGLERVHTRKGIKLMKESVCLGWEYFSIKLENSWEILAYHISSIGVAWDYANWANQISTYPKDIFKLPSVNATDTNIALREVLISMLHYPKAEPELLMETILKKARLEPAKRKMGRIYTTIEEILKTWKSKNYIKDFRFVKKKRNSHYKLVIVRNPKIGKTRKVGELNA